MWDVGWETVLGILGLLGSLLTAAYWTGQWRASTADERTRSREADARTDRRLSELEKAGPPGLAAEVRANRREIDRLTEEVRVLRGYVQSIVDDKLRGGGGVRFPQQADR